MEPSPGDGSSPSPSPVDQPYPPSDPPDQPPLLTQSQSRVLGTNLLAQEPRVRPWRC